MLLGDTIAAIASPPGRGRRGMVRLSGPACRSITRRLLDMRWPGRAAGSSRFSLANARSTPCLWLAFEAPRSYTTEDALELILPGNSALLERVLARLLDCEEVRLALPGEFTARAHLNGRFSLEQAEGVAMTIAARNDAELEAARRVLLGDAGDRYRALADELAGALALVEAGVDFSDQEDVVPITPDALRDRLAHALTQLDALLGGDVQTPRAELPRVAIVGSPNAGKSTLFNALLGERRSVVSDQAGATRDAIVQRLDLSSAAPGAGEVELVDLAGLDESSNTPLESQARARARAEIGRADALIWCDPSGRFTSLGIDAQASNTLRIRTKADLPGVGSHGESLAVCALDGWNLAALKRAVADVSAGASAADALVAPRHAQALRRAADMIAQAQERTRAQAHSARLVEMELIAQDLREGLDALGEITGRLSPDDVIGRVFASFCVGK